MLTVTLPKTQKGAGAGQAHCHQGLSHRGGGADCRPSAPSAETNARVTMAGVPLLPMKRWFVTAIILVQLAPRRKDRVIPVAYSILDCTNRCRICLRLGRISLGAGSGAGWSST
ncbi:hypothetical protein, partial [Paracoccus denitrificans]|uniref:hypothetical protein n=1 Tax=Paracoccus denitrificans TaxID=266 RepID=UPI001F47EA64